MTARAKLRRGRQKKDYLMIVNSDPYPSSISLTVPSTIHGSPSIQQHLIAGRLQSSKNMFKCQASNPMTSTRPRGNPPKAWSFRSRCPVNLRQQQRSWREQYLHIKAPLDNVLLRRKHGPSRVKAESPGTELELMCLDLTITIPGRRDLMLPVSEGSLEIGTSRLQV